MAARMIFSVALVAPEPLRPIVETLRKLIQEAAPDAESSLKWGMPFYTVAGGMMCAVGGHRSHVNLILSGPPGTYADPGGRLEGEGKTGRHLKLRTLDDLPRGEIVSGSRGRGQRNGEQREDMVEKF